jgi:N-acetylglutamate synthase-like GNAT family acetyltransferase
MTLFCQEIICHIPNPGKHATIKLQHGSMRGQKLFIRPIESDDSEAVHRFLETECGGQAILPARTGQTTRTPQLGLLGKLVGELVAVAEIRLTSDAIQIDNVIVARELRRKRIGRVMLDEIARLAEKMDRNRLIVGEPGTADEFFRRTGFEREGARWIRYVRSQGAQRASR